MKTIQVRPRGFRAAFALGAGFFSFFVAMAAQAQYARAGITVYEYPNFEGRHAIFRDEVSNLSDSGFNDRISSLTIAPGETWEVCSNRDFGGHCATLTGDVADLRRISWNDTISSMRPVRRDVRRGEGQRTHPTLVLWEGRDFHGRNFEIDHPDRSLSETGGRARSVTVRGGAWEICERPDFAGRCVTLTGDVANVRTYGFHDVVGSARPVYRNGDRWEYREQEEYRDRGSNAYVPAPNSRWASERPAARGETPRLILYERPNFAGRSVEVDSDATELSNFNDRAMSARAVGTWQICQDKDFGGRCVTISGDVPDLSVSYRLGTAITSARPVLDQRR